MPDGFLYGFVRLALPSIPSPANLPGGILLLSEKGPRRRGSRPRPASHAGRKIPDDHGSRPARPARPVRPAARGPLGSRPPKAETRRATRGPDRADMRRVWKALAGAEPRARRDRAMVALLFDLALRRNEVLALDRADLDLEGGSVAIVGKGHREAQR